MTQYDKKVVHRAGTIPYIIENDEPVMMFMIPSNPIYGGEMREHQHTDGTVTSELVSCPQLAKGKIEEGESTQEAALREAKEEIGLFYGNIIKTEEVGVFMGRTTVFVAKVKDRDLFGLPGEETESTRWMTESQFLSEGRSLHIPVIQAAVRMIKKIEGINKQ